MENKTEYQCQLFENRLKKKYKELRKWARKNRITCYRMYDKDIPEIPVSLDLYEFLPDDVTTTTECALFMNAQNTKLSQNIPGIEAEIKTRTYAVLYLYERPYEKDAEEEELWLSAMQKTAADVLNIPENHIIKKQRKMQKGQNQYEKITDSFVIKGLVQEQGQVFKINLTSYLDTGLFFDHRPLRKTIRDEASGKKVLNLFCYTGSFSVYAAQGNAKAIESIDMSNTYLSWAKENLTQNDFIDEKKFTFTKTDAVEFLKSKQKENSQDQLYDIIILDPPTFSNSKSTETVLDINRQWGELVNYCLNILNKNGTLYFSTNSTKLHFDETQFIKSTRSGLTVKYTDITNSTIPKDFEGTKCHKCWKFTVE